MIDLLPDERIDDLQCKGYQIIQNPNMFCFGMDAVLLANFVKHRRDGMYGSWNGNRCYTDPAGSKGTA